MNQTKSTWLENFLFSVFSEKIIINLKLCESNITTSWKELQIGNDLCDVTLACEDNQIKAYKIIISSYCPY